MRQWNKIPCWNPLYPDIVMNPKPPTLYAIMNSIANYDKEEYTKIRDLASACRSRIFDFDYELSSEISKEDFEKDILNHYIMRRIGFDTLTAFQLYLENKLHEILPFYNKLFDALSEYNLFGSGEKTTRVMSDSRNTTGSSTSTSSGTTNNEQRFSEYPMNQLSDITDGSYVSNQTLNNGSLSNTSSINSSGTDNGTTNEIIERSPSDKMEMYKKYLETRRSIMSMIYKELDILFYGLAD